MQKRIVIFASGNGTNAQNIIRYFLHHPQVKVVRVLSNKKDAKVLERSKALGIKAQSFTKEAFLDPGGVLKILKRDRPNLIVLAGFLWKFPSLLLNEFHNKVINIHPALLPKYGGKGMYGNFVHEAIVANKEPETGITIHYVNEAYDEGAIIFQARVALEADDTPEVVAGKVHKLEYEHLPKVIETLLLKKS